MKYLLVFLFSIPLLVFGQVDLQGIVLDSLNKEPIGFATVFINGTTKGTTTDLEGGFFLKNISIPAEVIITHLSYGTQRIYINSLNPNPLKVELGTNNISLPEATIADKNLRQKNIKEFKKLFLGIDEWGRTAVLKNEDALIFHRSFTERKMMIRDSIRSLIRRGIENRIAVVHWKEAGENIVLNLKNISRWNNDSTNIIIKEPIFKVTASQPLIVDLPRLGYELQVTQLNFTAEYIAGNAGSVILGYFYYQPYDATRKSKIKKQQKNRKAAYYNSRQHFFRALYANQLEENGFTIIERPSNKKINIDDYLKPIKDNIREVDGLKNKELLVLYHSRAKGDPAPINEKKASFIVQSKILFLCEICKIRNDGTTSDANIVFGNWIGMKKVGSMLPDDYRP